MAYVPMSLQQEGRYNVGKPQGIPISKSWGGVRLYKADCYVVIARGNGLRAENVGTIYGGYISRRVSWRSLNLKTQS